MTETGHEACTIFSLMPIQIYEVKSGIIPGTFTIPKSDGKNPSTLIVGPSHYFIYLDESRGSIKSLAPAYEVAQSIVEDFKSSQIGMSDDASPGLGWIVGRFSSGEMIVHVNVLKDLKEKQRKWYQNICRLADNDWARYHHHNAISDIQRTAANELGLNVNDHEWMSITATEGLVNCPACGSKVGKDIVVCPMCRCVLNVEKHKSLVFA